MKTKLILVAIIFFGTKATIKAQRALPLPINSLFSKIPPIPNDCGTSFQLCTKDTDATNGIISVKDAGKVINDLQQITENDVQQLATSSMTSSYSNPTASIPSQDQMSNMMQNSSQMQNMSPQEAMKMAQQMQNQNRSPTAINTDLMQEIGKGQDAAAKLNVVLNELNTKGSQLTGTYQQKMDNIKMTGSCEEFKVEGADLMLPKCGCVKSINMDFHQKRVAVSNEYLQNLEALLQRYLPKIKGEIAIVDKVEQDLNYGDALSLPALKSQAVTLQQEVFGSVMPILGLVGDKVKETGSEYADLTNIKNGHLPEACQ
ncbi:MAG: hypothetical protein KGM16_15055 [Bacteroidota bacterium]|nr:hypothetical protein [Bacteroidota bacterium]